MLSDLTIKPKLPEKAGETLGLGEIIGSECGLRILALAKHAPAPMLLITPDMHTANRLQAELAFFNQGGSKLPILIFPDWEILPYDHFSPHQDIISERLKFLYQLPLLNQGIIIISINTLMHRLPPTEYVHANSFIFHKGDQVDIPSLRKQFETGGYYAVSQVMQHGEFAVRGSIIDLFPMGASLPFRIDLFGDEIDSIRTFNPDTQRTIDKVDEINLLPAHEFPSTDDGKSLFRTKFRSYFANDPSDCPIYIGVSQGESPAGIEYYLPLFFEKTAILFDYLKEKTILVRVNDLYKTAENFWQEVMNRYEQLRHDITRPILSPEEIVLSVTQLFHYIKQFPQVVITNITDIDDRFNSESKARQPLNKLKKFINTANKRILFCAESAGRKEVLLELLQEIEIRPTSFNHWHAFLQDTEKVGITIGYLDQGLELDSPPVVLITETQLFGQQVQQRRLRKRSSVDPEAMLQSLAELQIGSPIVHIDYGVGRYRGLQTMETGEISAEYLVLEYYGGDKIYVPVANLHLISRYSGVDIENAPLNKLGSRQWEKIKKKTVEKIRDVAAELLDVYAKRESAKGFKFNPPNHDYQTFSSAFAFEETIDQQQTIDAIIDDMVKPKTMDRLVCGDVGFGKTEVAIRASFLAAHSNKQIAMLVPTTLLAEQHLETFKDRYADWPIKIEALSRFRSKKEQTKILQGLKTGTIDIVIATHRLLQPDVKFKDLGLLIVDEEHRFGVRQKERIKAIRANVDILTLTATPIPRTLNMAFSNLRDLSIIATPPAKRLSIKTFVGERNNSMIREAILRETLRGGQVYFLHNKVQSIERIADELRELIPEARINIAHGQLRERELEKIMTDFYHQRFNLLVCTTIIESGIDVPTANTIVIDRADRFGLAQLHQLRGRVGRSHHQAYAYLLTPPVKLLGRDAKKRLDAIASLEDLGAGFSIATHDLEIRGAGELLGEEQSGQIEAIGFNLYIEMLEQTVKALKTGKTPDVDISFAHGSDIDLQIPALLPENYVPDVHTRLILYKRIASAKNAAELKELKAELIDRFGLLHDAAQNLFTVTKIKLQAMRIGIKTIKATADALIVEFVVKPNIDAEKLINLIQQHPAKYKLRGNEKLQITCIKPSADAKVSAIEQFFSRIAD